MTRDTHARTASALLRTVARGVGRLTLGIGTLAGLSALLIGPPWGLTLFVGWPLPDHVPTVREVTMWLWYGSFHTGVLINILALACWIVWAVFAVDVARCLAEATRGIRWPEATLPPAPTRFVASLLVGGLLLALLGHRIPGTSATALPTAHASTTAIVATASPQPHRDTDRPTATVAKPKGGVYDSLWRIADRRLDKPTRWPTIWHLNKHQVQTDGRVFTDPHLIQPGWKLLLPTRYLADRGPQHRPDPRLDPDADPDAGADRPAVGASPTSKRGAPNTANTPPPARADARGDPATAHDVDEPEHRRVRSPAEPDPGTGITLPTGGYVGLGLAALIVALAITVRLWRRRTYRPGSGDRDDDPSRAPIVRALRVAHEQAVAPHYPDGTLLHPTSESSTPAEAATRQRARASAAAILPAEPNTVVGERSGHAVALDLARTCGLGLIGPGAPAAARALLINLLTPRDATNAAPATCVVVPASDLPTLVGSTASLPQPPHALRIVTDLDAALDILQTELLTRRRTTAENEKQRPTPGAVVLMARAPTYAEARLRALLQDGAAYGLASVLIGQWRPGGTAYVLDDGTVSATSPPLADHLDGTRLFTLPVSDTAALLDLLRAANDATQDYNPQAADPDTCEVGTDTPDAPHPSHDPPPDATSDAASRVETTTDRGIDADNDPKAADYVTPSTMSDRSDTEPAMTLCVLGRPHLYHRTGDDTTDLIEAVSPKQREILTYLALHRSGASSEAITTAIWPDAHGRRPRNTFHVTVSQLRKALRTTTHDTAPDPIVVHDGHYILNPEQVTVDLWQLQDLLRDSRTTENATRQQALRRIAEFSHGSLGAGITAEWIEAPREALRRDVLDAISGLIHTLGKGHDDRKLALLELARGLDQYNEAIYRDIARTLARLGHADAIPRTRKLLTDTLADINERPRRDTLDLMESLQRAAETHPMPPIGDKLDRTTTAPPRRRASQAPAKKQQHGPP